MKNNINEIIKKLENSKVNNLSNKNENKYIYFDCPYCGNKRSNINKENSRFSCFKCKKNEGIDQFFRNSGIDSEVKTKTLNFSSKKYDLESVLKEVFLFQYYFLRQSKAATKEREIVKSKDINNLEFGFSPEDEFLIARALKEVAGFSDSDLIKTGLFIKKTKGLSCVLTGYITTPLYENEKMITVIGLNYNNKFPQETKISKNVFGFNNNQAQFKARQDIYNIWSK